MTLHEKGSPSMWIPSYMKGGLLVSWGSKNHDTNFFLVDVADFLGWIHWLNWILVGLNG
jgi:hypothetical protein